MVAEKDKNKNMIAENSYLFGTGKELCTGCRACEFVCGKHQAITMDEDTEGFLYPKIDFDKCIDCRLCEKRCPITLENEGVKFDKSFTAELYGAFFLLDAPFCFPL